MIPLVPKQFPNVTNNTDSLHKVKLKRWLGTRTITSVAYSAEPTGLIFHDQDDTIDTNTTTQVWIKSFASNTDYIIKGKVTASDNEIEEFRARIKCLQGNETA